MRDLTHRQRKFVTAILSNGFNAVAAAREAGYSERSSKSYASRLSAKPANKAAIAEEQDRIADANGITLGHVIREFELIRDLAKKAGAFRAATSAQASIAEMCGFLGRQALINVALPQVNSVIDFTSRSPVEPVDMSYVVASDSDDDVQPV